MNRSRLIEIPRFVDERGTLSVLEGPPLLPFAPRRFFYIYGVREGAERGCHALRFSEEVIIPLAGSFHITTDDGRSKTDYLLNRADQGLYIPPLSWHVLHHFSPDAVCGVLASTPYNSSGYFRDYEEFLQAVRSR